MNVLITGASGFLGAAVARRFLKAGHKVIGYSRNPARLIANCPADIIPWPGDVRNFYYLSLAMSTNVDAFIHCAAEKCVGDCEQRPENAISANLMGTANVLRAALENGVHCGIFISSDKATDRTIYGTTKWLGERLVSEAARNSGAYFNSVRLGNLMGSTGSVFPLWRKALKETGHITLHEFAGQAPRRFVMSAQEAADFVYQLFGTSLRGCTFAKKMPIMDLRILAQLLADAPHIRTGPLDQSALHQVVITAEESRQTRIGGNCYIFDPAAVPDGGCPWTYSTEDRRPMTRNETKDWLIRAELVDDWLVCS